MSTEPVKLVCLVLAAGQSKRFGEADKRFTELASGKSILEQTLCNIETSGLNYICAIGEHDIHLPQIASMTKHLIPIHQPELGMGHTLASAIKQLHKQYSAFLICLGDMPYIQAPTYRKIAEALLNTESLAIVPHYSSKPAQLEHAGHPIGIQGELITKFSDLSGDKGGKEILRELSNKLEFIAINSAEIYADIDTPEQT